MSHALHEEKTYVFDITPNTSWEEKTLKYNFQGKSKHTFHVKCFFLSRKLCYLWHCCEKYGRVRQAIEHGVVQGRRNMHAG